MIHYIKKDITKVSSPAIIMHGVNCQGKMGKGVAKSLSLKYPDVYLEYVKLDIDKMELGTTQIVNVSKDLYVANCFTQKNYGSDGKVYANSIAILKCLLDVAKLATLLKITEVYSPKIGCGLGGLNWESDVFKEFRTVNIEYPNINFYICDL